MTIRLLTNRRDWTSPQREMMDRAARYYGVRAALLLAVVVLMLGIGWEAIGRLRAQVLRDRVLEATTDGVPASALPPMISSTPFSTGYRCR